MNPEVNKELLSLLGATLDLRLAAHLVHLNVVGSTAYQNHLLTMRIYEALNDAIDEIGEHIRTLGVFLPDSHKIIVGQSFLNDMVNSSDAGVALPALVTSLESIRDRWNSLSTLSQDAGDQLTADLAAGQGRCNAKLAYLVKSVITSSRSTANSKFSNEAFKAIANKNKK